jgi:hypothetical protein
MYVPDCCHCLIVGNHVVDVYLVRLRPKVVAQHHEGVAAPPHSKLEACRVGNVRDRDVPVDGGRSCYLNRSCVASINYEYCLSARVIETAHLVVE